MFRRKSVLSRTITSYFPQVRRGSNRNVTNAEPRKSAVGEECSRPTQIQQQPSSPTHLNISNLKIERSQITAFSDEDISIKEASNILVNCQKPNEIQYQSNDACILRSKKDFPIESLGPIDSLNCESKGDEAVKIACDGPVIIEYHKDAFVEMSGQVAPTYQDRRVLISSMKPVSEQSILVNGEYDQSEVEIRQSKIDIRTTNSPSQPWKKPESKSKVISPAKETGVATIIPFSCAEEQRVCNESQRYFLISK